MAAPAKALMTLILIATTASAATPPAQAPASAASTALEQARRTGQPVELESERTETDRVFVNPSGTHTLETHVMPVRARIEGDWVPIDTTLRLRPDGSVGPVATATPMTFGGGGGGAVVTLAERDNELSLSWPRPLPAPELSGDTATYPEVLPGVDLKLRALAAGFAQVLVVKDRAAAANPELGRLRFALASKNLGVQTDADGTAVARDPSGKAVFAAGAPTMWDSGEKHSAIRLEASGRELAVLPDAAMLNDPGTTYPVYIDPSYSSVQYRWTMVNQDAPSTSYWTDAFYREDARVGSVYGTGQGPWRTFFQVNIARLARTTITKAWFSVTAHHSGACAATSVELWHTAEIDPAVAVTWNNSSTSTSNDWLDGSALDTRNVQANKATCGYNPQLVEFGVANGKVKTLVQTAVSGTAPKEALGFGLKIPPASETNGNYWKRFTQSTARLNVEFNGAPRIPTGVTTVPPTLCGTVTAPTPLNTATPTFTGVGYDPDGDNVSNTMELLSGETVIATAPTGTVGSGSAVSWPPVSSGVLPDNDPAAVFSYRAKTNDATLSGTTSTRCYFTVDTARPSTPTITTTDFPNGLPGKPVGEPGMVTFTKSAADSDMAGFSYGFSSSGTTSWVPIKADGTATVALTLWPDSPGDPGDVFKTLFVRAVDHAGNVSPLNPGWALTSPGRLVLSPGTRFDVNGDRRADVTAVINQGFGRTAVWNFLSAAGDVSHGYIGWDSGINGGFPLERIQSVTGDFDGDGRTDVAVMREDPGPVVRLFILRSDGTRFIAASDPVWTGTTFRVSHLKLVAGDFDGDGDDDIAELQGLIDRQTRIWVHTSNGGFFGEPVMRWDSGVGVRTLAQTNPLAGDFDGDGDDDIADVYDAGGNQARLMLHLASAGTLAAPVQAWDSGVGTFAASRAQFTVANVDSSSGDDEVVALFDDGGSTSRLVVLTGTGSTAWTSAAWWSSAAGGFDSSKAVLFTGDFNADGRADAAALTADRVYSFASSGTSFAAPVQRWQGPIGAGATTAFVAPGRKYRIQPVHTNKCWDVPNNSTTNGAIIDQWDCVATATWEKFTLERIGASPNFFIKTSGGKCLDLKSWSLLDNAQLVQWTCGVPAQTNQQFRVEYVSGFGLDMIVTIRSVHSDKCLQVSGGGTANGAAIVQFSCGTSLPTYRQFFLRADP